MMKNPLKLFALVVFVAMTVVSCHSDDPSDEPENTVAQQTVLMYIPWAGSGSIQESCQNGITKMAQAIAQRGGLGNKRFMVLVANSSTTADLYELKYRSANHIDRDTITSYSGLTGANFATQDGLTTFFNNVKKSAPAEKYAIIISCHGMGWLPAGTTVAQAKTNLKMCAPSSEPIVESRYYGTGNSGDKAYQTDITTLRQAILQSFGHTDYIMFDDCYMQNIETAYWLRNVTDYVLASTSEIIMEGLPYHKIGNALLNDDYESVVNGVHDYFSANRYPYGTFSYVVTSELEQLAALMKTANGLYEMSRETRNNVQALDLYGKIGYFTIFFDMGSYIKNLCGSDTSLKDQIITQLNKAVPNKKTTDYIFHANGSGSPDLLLVLEFSGITISDPSSFYKATISRENTDWWAATH